MHESKELQDFRENSIQFTRKRKKKVLGISKISQTHWSIKKIKIIKNHKDRGIYIQKQEPPVEREEEQPTFILQRSKETFVLPKRSDH